MTYSTIVSVYQLAENLANPDWVVIDSRSSLVDKEWGFRAYRNEHIAGAIYADLEKDLSGPVIPGVTGRHPLPEVGVLVKKFGSWGINHDVQVVVYDDAGGTYAARLWWLLRWTGHEAAAVLDGGWQRWKAAGYPTTAELSRPEPRSYQALVRSERMISSLELVQKLDDPQTIIIDARDRLRYLGLEEPIDPIAGHIPGAVSSPYALNLTDQGLFKPANQLRDYYGALLDHSRTETIVVYCGSGVTAAHNVLALELAGLSGARLYVGSWSEWITDPQRPIVQEGYGKPNV
jgi:thiosulfate/3-mercaptopyruvate sulfurtransferase